MPSPKGPQPKRAALYARVSTEGQAEKGYSLAQQIEALKEHAAYEGFEVVAEITDPGYSGASLERPGLNRVRDLAAAGGIDVVLAQDRDRFARDPVLMGWLQRMFEGYGTKLRALNDRGDDSPSGQLLEGILDQIAQFERAMTAERTARGKLQRAKEGKVVPLGFPPYGYEYNPDRTNYVVNKAEMAVIRRIFQMMANGATLYSVQRAMEQDGVPAPKGGKYWNPKFIRDVVNDDVYRPHTRQEIDVLVAEGRMGEEVAARLHETKLYGIWFYGRLRVTLNPTGETRRKYTKRDPSEWVAVPVPDAGIPIQEVTAAREAIKDNRPHSRAAGRCWELSGGTAYCACGRRMRTIARRKGAYTYNYYVCQRRPGNGRGKECGHAKHHRAEPLEQKVRDFVSDLLKKPERLERLIEAAIERHREALRDPSRGAKKWRQMLEEADRMRSAYQDQQAAGFMTLKELGKKLEQLDETRETAKRELKVVDDRRERIKELQFNKGFLLGLYKGTLEMRGLEEHTPEERRDLYRRLGLKVVIQKDGSIEVTGSFDADLLSADQNTAQRLFEEAYEALGIDLPEGSEGSNFLPHSYNFEVSVRAKRSTIQSKSTRARLRL